MTSMRLIPGEVLTTAACKLLFDGADALGDQGAGAGADADTGASHADQDAGAGVGADQAVFQLL